MAGIFNEIGLNVFLNEDKINLRRFLSSEYA